GPPFAGHDIRGYLLLLAPMTLGGYAGTQAALTGLISRRHAAVPRDRDVLERRDIKRRPNEQSPRFEALSRRSDSTDAFLAQRAATAMRGGRPGFRRRDCRASATHASGGPASRADRRGSQTEIRGHRFRPV